MTDELVGNLSAFETYDCSYTYERTVFPDPATMQGGISSCSRNENCTRTKAMDPKQATNPLPLFEYVTMRKPCGSATVTRFASNIVVHPRIWRG
jgi:hypothetical protein